jgi:hypothetical protein
MKVRSDLTTEQLIYRGRAEGWLIIPQPRAALALSRDAGR